MSNWDLTLGGTPTIEEVVLFASIDHLCLSLGHFAYWKMSFDLKNVGVTLQWTMSYPFHDINEIMEAYLDDLLLIQKEDLSIYPTYELWLKGVNIIRFY